MPTRPATPAIGRDPGPAVVRSPRCPKHHVHLDPAQSRARGAATRPRRAVEQAAIRSASRSTPRPREVARSRRALSPSPPSAPAPLTPTSPATQLSGRAQVSQSFTVAASSGNPWPSSSSSIQANICQLGYICRVRTPRSLPSRAHWEEPGPRMWTREQLELHRPARYVRQLLLRTRSSRTNVSFAPAANSQYLSPAKAPRPSPRHPSLSSHPEPDNEPHEHARNCQVPDHRPLRDLGLFRRLYRSIRTGVPTGL